ncbi:Potassium channel subfamily K member [Echinococcus granulosus]|uniref:Potassium channel subfamily K member n=1 Tax=Echinococcus granulosus TaxID=6210 RepID=W6UU25_ECHGR|nr:Potassium channel subfamily K member [Echinococcus granulosus]EUB64813.1 Potassium channel subfamily K member [Echinococcus granulosus]
MIDELRTFAINLNATWDVSVWERAIVLIRIDARPSWICAGAGALVTRGRWAEGPPMHLPPPPIRREAAAAAAGTAIAHQCNAESRLKDYSPQRSKTVSPSTNVSPTTNQSVNTYENLQPPPKPSFNPATSLQLLTVEEQNLAPPKPSLEPPQSEGLDSLIYSTLKEFRPTVEQVKSDPPREEVNQSLNSSTGSKKFTVTPVPSGGSPAATTFVESFSSRGSNDDVQSKIAAPQEPLKYITVPEDLVNLDRRRKHGLEGLDWYLHGLELSKEIIPRHWIEGIVSENSSSTFQDLINSTTPSPTSQNLFTATAPNNIASFATVRNGTSYSFNYDSDYRYIMETLFNGSSNADQISNITFLAESVRANVTRIIATYVNQVVHAIKDEGWNGASNFDDINWTFEGGVLFAITVITTIGYGHVTPQTQYGKLLTMLYAVIGIPLFFIYLSKNGDMMASLFRLAYARGCKPVFRMISRRRSRNATKNGLYNSMQSLALIANLDSTVMRLHHKDSTNSNDSTNLDRNLSIHSTKTTHSEGSPPADFSRFEKKCSGRIG